MIHQKWVAMCQSFTVALVFAAWVCQSHLCAELRLASTWYKSLMLL